MAKLCIIGSLNIDLTLTLKRFHEPGESMFAEDFNTYLGGKGGNQSVCAAKLGNSVSMIGKLGDDQYASLYRKAFKELNIDDDGVQVAENTPTGIAIIEVDAKGENRIVAVKGANSKVDIEQIKSLMPKILENDIFLLQLEIPIETIVYVVKELKKANKTIILDPAPATPVPDEVFANVSIVTPNETELFIHTGLSTKTDEEVVIAARSLINKGAKIVIAKLGKRGAMLVTENHNEMLNAFKVNAIDTTAAGDSFNAGLASALAHGKDITDAIRFANATAAISTTAKGAQAAMPNQEQVMKLLNEQK